MSNRKFLFFFFCLQLVIFNLAAQQPKDGETKFYFPNGKLSSEGMMVKGKPDGYWKSYYENGQLKSEGNRVNFKLEGEWKFYADTGGLSSLYNYHEGIKNGLQQTFYPGGGIQSEEIDSMAVKNGPQKFYSEDGKLMKIIPFVNGVEHGISKEYNSSGTLITITTYRNGYFQKEEKINRVDKLGLKQGIYRTYYDNDNPKSEGNYRDDKKDGFFKEYDLEGRVISKEEYRNGELVVARTKTDEVYFKVYHWSHHEKDPVKLTSFNPAYPVIEISRKELRFIQPVHSVVRRLRKD